MGESSNAQNEGATVCSNCGARVTGAYCSQCGQSRKSLLHPATELFKDIVDSAISWDGRFLSTFRDLYLRPGAVARRYMDGERAKFAPPFRLYVVISILFFILIPLSGIAVIGLMPADATPVNAERAVVDPTNNDLAGVTIVLFCHPSVARPPSLSQEEIRQLEGTDAVNSLQYRMLLDPEEAEARLSAAAAKAMLSMVVVFALINMVLHPKRQVINHAIYSLYFHAAMMPLLAAGVIIGAWAQTLAGIVGMLVTIIIATAVLLLAWLGERNFYETGFVGASLRMVPMMVFYFAAMLGILLGFALLTI